MADLGAREPSLVAFRLRRLDATARRMAVVLAALGKPQTPELLGQALEVSPAEALEALDALLRAGVAHQLRPGRFGLTEGGASAAAPETAGLPDTSGLHRLALAAAPDEDRLHHALAVGGELAIAEALAAAARAGDAGTPAVAVQALQTTLAACPAAAHDEHILWALAQHLEAAGNPRAALRAWNQWRRHAAAPEAPETARFAMARLLGVMGKYAQGLRLLRAYIDGPVRDGPATAEAYPVAADLLYLSGAYDAGLALCRRAAAKLAGVPGAWLGLVNIEGKLLLNRGDFTGAEERFRLAAGRARAMGMPSLAGKAQNNLGNALLKQGRKDDALACYQDCLLLGQVTGDASRQAFAHLNIGVVAHERSELGKAIQHYLEASALFLRAGNRTQHCRTLKNLAELLIGIHDLARAETVLTQAEEAAAAMGDAFLAANCQIHRAQLALKQGMPQAARRHLQAAEGLAAQMRSPIPTAEAALVAAEAALAEGSGPGAQQQLRGAEPKVTASRSAVLEARLKVLEAQAPAAADGAKAAKLAEALAIYEAAGEKLGCIEVLALLQAEYSGRGLAAEARRTARRGWELAQAVSASLDDGALRAFQASPPVRWLRLAARIEERAPAAPAPVAPAPAAPPHGMIGHSPVFTDFVRRLLIAARDSGSVLLLGESGTGKELAAQAIHETSTRAAGPFVAVHAAAFPDELLASELFGHEKGAFTGADRQRKGRFELADGGTLFLDEIGDISPKAQVALLRVLETGEFERSGGGSTLRVNVRVVAATNRDLRQMVRDGTFREDLYFRLKEIQLRVPALRERGQDAVLLAGHFLQAMAPPGGDPPVLDASARALLLSYPWPGNIRELRNALRGAALFADGLVRAENLRDVLDIEDTAAVAAAGRATGPEGLETLARAVFEGCREGHYGLAEARRELETQVIAMAMDAAGGNVTEAAKLLGMGRSRLSQIINDTLKKAGGTK